MQSQYSVPVLSHHTLITSSYRLTLASYRDTGAYTRIHRKIKATTGYYESSYFEWRMWLRRISWSIATLGTKRASWVYGDHQTCYRRWAGYSHIAGPSSCPSPVQACTGLGCVENHVQTHEQLPRTVLRLYSLCTGL